MAAAGFRQPGGPGARRARAAPRARAASACTTPICSPARAAWARPRSRASSPSASTARPASPRSPAASARPAWRSTPAASSTCWRSTRPPTPRSTRCASCSRTRSTRRRAGRFKVYVIDEVHMLSGHAFNAMLKTLEEPPEHMKFILATTDPQKIPVTVLSRCLQFNLKQMPQEAIATHLGDDSGQGDRYQHEPEALGAARARGRRQHARRAVAARPGDRARRRQGRRRQAWATCWAPSTRAYLLRLVEAVAGGDAAAAVKVADEMQARSLSFDTALADLASLLLRVALAQSLPDAVDDADASRRACRAARRRIGAALLPDRAAGPARPAARARRARRVRDDGAAHACVQAGRRRAQRAADAAQRRKPKHATLRREPQKRQ